MWLLLLQWPVVADVATVLKVGKGGRLVASLATGAFALASLHAPPASSAPLTGGASRYQYSDSSPDEERLLQEVQDSLARKKALDDQIADLDRRLETTQGNLTDAQNVLGVAMAKERGVEVKLADIQRQLTAAQDALRTQAVAAYIGRRTNSSVADLLRTASIDQFATKQSYIQVVSATEADLIVDRERLQATNNDLLAQLDGVRASAQRQRDYIAKQQSSLSADRSAQAAARYQLSVAIADNKDALQEITARRDEFEAQARDLQAQSEAVAESLGRSSSSSSSSSSASSSSNGRLSEPLSKYTITSEFGYRVHPIYGTTLLHSGVDLAIASGTPIKAAAAGKVVSAGWLGGYGNATIIDHGGGLATLYGHQSAILVSVGQSVSKGQVIGRVGCTGSCTGPHLHFEVRINGEPVDPMPYL